MRNLAANATGDRWRHSDLLDFDEQRKSIQETVEFLQRTEDEVGARIEALKPKARIKKPALGGRVGRSSGQISDHAHSTQVTNSAPSVLGT